MPKSNIFTERVFHTSDLKGLTGRITWYTLQSELPKKYSSILCIEFTDTTSSAGDWNGLIFQRIGKSVYAIPFSQTNTGDGFEIRTGGTFATTSFRDWKNAKQDIIKEYIEYYAEGEGLLELFDAFLEDTSKTNSLHEGKTTDKKKAFLVGFCPKTRVIIDVPDDYDGQEPSDSLTDEIIRTARQKMSSSLEDYLNGDNCDIVEEDLECPYDENDPSDNPDARYWVLVNRQGDRLFQYGKMIYEDEAQRVLRSAQRQHPTAGIHLERRYANEED